GGNEHDRAFVPNSGKRTPADRSHLAREWTVPRKFCNSGRPGGVVKYSRFRLVAVVLLVCLAAVFHVALSVPKDVQAAVVNPTPAQASRPSVPTSLYAQAARALRQNNLQ